MIQNSKFNVGLLYEKSASSNPWKNQDYVLVPEMQPQTLVDVFLKNKQMAQIPIPPIQKSVICGTCVGDASLKINKNYKNARIQCRHSTTQADWFFWKYLICLKNYVNGFDSICFQPIDGKQPFKPNSLYGKLKVTTKASPDFTQIYDLITSQKKINLQRKWLNHMNNYFLMTLWLDDGSLYHKNQGVFCLDSIPFEQQKVLSVYLKSVWRIECVVKPTGKIMSNGKPSYRLHFKDQTNLLNFFKIIAPIIPVKQMLYKIKFVPKNNLDLLQRWASDVVELVHPDFKTDLKLEYTTLIANYKIT